MLNPIKLPLQDGSKMELEIKKFLRDRVRSIRLGLKDIQETRLIKWRKIYEAEPVASSRSFPFENASNLVVPIVAIHSDTLLARVMSAVIKTKPLWTLRILGTIAELEQSGEANAQEVRNLLEEFMQAVGLEPSDLDLYRVYHSWYGETIRLGTSVIKIPQEEIVEDVVSGDGTGRYNFTRKTISSGPRPEKIAFEDFGISPSATSVDRADFKYHRVRLQRYQLEERAASKHYDPDKVKAILDSPDRTSPGTIQQDREQSSGAHTTAGYGWAEYDIYECWFRYTVNNYKVRCICWYHEKTDTLLRSYFDYYPENIFVAARLFYRDDAFHGYGFCEMLSMLQEEVSSIHNDRRNNQTVANTRVWRVDPLSKLHQGYKIFPSAMLPAEEGEIEPMAHGELSQINMDEERLAIELAERRSGVSPPQQGAGAGTNSKRGVYTAMGTLSLLQEGNTRTDLNITDIRYAHGKVGRIIARQFAEFGIGDRAKQFGDKATKILRALELFKDGSLALPIQAATASINREVEKQNDMMLTQVVNKHYSTITQMLQMATNAMTVPEIKTYLMDAIKSANILMRTVMLHFNYDEVERLIPEVSASSSLAGQSSQPGAGQPQQVAGQPSTGGAASPLGPGGGAAPPTVPSISPNMPVMPPAGGVQ